MKMKIIFTKLKKGNYLIIFNIIKNSVNFKYGCRIKPYNIFNAKDILKKDFF